MKKIFLITATLLLSAALHAQSAAAEDSARRLSDALLPDAVVRIDARDFDGAWKILDKADRIFSANDAVKYYKGYVCAARKDIPGALENFTAAYLLDTSNYWYRTKLAYLYLATGKPVQAERMYRSILRTRPYDAEAIAHLSDLCISSGALHEADSLLNVIDRLQGPNEYTELSRIEILRQEGRYDEFFGKLNVYMRESGCPPAEKTGLMTRLLKSSMPNFNYLHLEQITTIVETCLEVHPSDTSVAHFAASFYYSLNKDAKVRDIAARFPKDTLMTEFSYICAMRMKDYQAALEACDNQMELSEGNTVRLAQCHASKGDCYQYMGQTDKAFKEYGQSLKLVPDNPVVLNNYAYFMACQGRNLAKCEKMAAKVLKAEGENPTYLDTYAYILYRRHKYAEAKIYFKKALLYGGKDHAEILSHYADTLEALGETALAGGYRLQAQQKRDEAKK